MSTDKVLSLKRRLAEIAQLCKECLKMEEQAALKVIRQVVKKKPWAKSILFDIAAKKWNSGNKAQGGTLFGLLAALGDTEALYYYAIQQRSGLGCLQDYYYSRKLFRKGALKGHVGCMKEYGLMLSLGDDPVLKKKALYWSKKAAVAGDAESAIKVAEYYEFCLQDRPNYTKANEFYRIALEQNADGWAAYCLGFNYYFGRGCKRDYDAAFRYFNQSFELIDESNRTRPAYFLAWCYLKGQGCSPDTKKGLELLEMAADNYHHLAKADLGGMYYYGMYGLKKDLQKANYWWHRGSAEEGNCRYGYGTCLFEGRGIKRNRREAIDVWSRGDYHLGCSLKAAWCYWNGFGVKRDVQMVLDIIRWSNRGAGKAFSAYMLGLCHLSGEGVEQSDTEALRCFRTAAEAKVPHALHKLGTLYEKGFLAERDLSRAADLYRQADKKGYPDGSYDLGRCYEHGIGIPQDKSRAVSLYRKAAAKGQSQAIRALKRLGKAPKLTASATENKDLCICVGPKQLHRPHGPAAIR